MTNLVKRVADDEFGATAIEYGLIAAGISSQLAIAASNRLEQLISKPCRNTVVLYCSE